MNPPLPPKSPPPPQEESSSWLTTILSLLLLGGVLVGLVLVSLGSILGPLLLLLVALPAVAMFHYLLWGWWLGEMIEESNREDDLKR